MFKMFYSFCFSILVSLSPFIDTKHQPPIPWNFLCVFLLESEMGRQILLKQQFQGSGAMTWINAY